MSHQHHARLFDLIWINFRCVDHHCCIFCRRISKKAADGKWQRMEWSIQERLTPCFTTRHINSDFSVIKSCIWRIVSPIVKSSKKKKCTKKIATKMRRSVFWYCNDYKKYVNRILETCQATSYFLTKVGSRCACKYVTVDFFLIITSTDVY